MKPSAAYLIAYNATQALVWFLVLLRVFSSVVKYWESTDAITKFSLQALPLVIAAQLMSSLEIFHIVIGMTKGGLLQSIGQIFGRDICLFLTIVNASDSCENLATVFLFVSWALAEIIRYPYYVLSILDRCPDFLRFLRYSAFILLYPMGFLAEISCFLIWLCEVQVMWYGIYLVPVYLIGAPKLYKYMLQARKKQLHQKKP